MSGLRLIADIGGTNARFAVSRADSSMDDVAVLACADFADPVAAAKAYLARAALPEPPERAVFALAAPVTGDHVVVTNHSWSFSIDDVRRRLGLEDLEVINDFSAVALALPHLTAADVLRVGGGEAAPDAPMALLGPGTGLGVSALIPTGNGWMPLATEGGHVSMTAFDSREEAVLATLRGSSPVSAEQVISGRGLVNLYRTLCEIDGHGADPTIAPADVTARALDGACPVCVEALDMFCSMLGTVASNLALTLGARGGVFIAGGIVPRLGQAFAVSRFRHRFEDKGRFSNYMVAVPTFVVTHQFPALLGLSRR